MVPSCGLLHSSMYFNGLNYFVQLLPELPVPDNSIYWIGWILLFTMLGSCQFVRFSCSSSLEFFSSALSGVDCRKFNQVERIQFFRSFLPELPLRETSVQAVDCIPSQVNSSRSFHGLNRLISLVELYPELLGWKN